LKRKSTFKAKTPKEKATEEAIAEIFKDYDTDKNGLLEYSEAKLFFEEVCKGEDEDIDEEHLKKMFEQFDKDDNGVIDKDELR